MSGGDVERIDLVKSFGWLRVVDGINLHIPGGESFSLLGSSGCGKTTTMRIISGLSNRLGE